MDPLVIHEDPIHDGIWRCTLDGHAIEIVPEFGYVKIDGRLHQVAAVQGLTAVTDLAGAPLDAITRLLTTPAPTGSTTPPRMAPRRRESARTKRPAKPNKPPQSQTPLVALNTEAAATFLGLSPKTLETQRSRGDGPPFVKLGRRVVYRQTDLEQWLQARVRRSTSDTEPKE